MKRCYYNTIRKSTSKRLKVDRNQFSLELDFSQEETEREIFNQVWETLMTDLERIFSIIFKKAAKLCHPDINPDLPNSEYVFKELSDAMDKREYWKVEQICIPLFANHPRTNGETFEDVFNEIKKTVK